MAALTVWSIWKFEPRSHSRLHYTVLVCFVLVGVLACAFEWWMVLRGRLIHHQNYALNLTNGEMSFEVPNQPFVLWLFFDVPLSYYHGQITIAGDNGTEYVIALPRKRIWSMRNRGNYGPLIWRRPTSGDAPVLRQIRLKFHLVPTFAQSPFRDRFPTREFESVELVVRSC